MTDKTNDIGSRRDVRLDVFRGLANWAIFIDHIPNNVVAWLTTRNYGFSDAADLFVYISGYTATFVYARYMRASGFLVGASLLLGRVWQIYVAHVLLFVAYVASIGYVAQTFDHSHLLDEFNVRLLIKDPIEMLKHGLLLQFKPLNLDVLPLYIVIMAMFPPALWAVLRYPNPTLAASFLLYVAAQIFGWNLRAYPAGTWYFNPYAWQFLFMIGAWMASGGAKKLRSWLQRREITVLAILYLLLSFAVAMAVRFPEIGSALPAEFLTVFANDKTNLTPVRILHFLALAFIVVQLVPNDAAVLKSRLLRPAIVCGQRSLEVFCVGVFLSFVGHFLIELISDSVAFQIVVSVAGIGAMTAVASYRTWTKGLRSVSSKQTFKAA